MTYSDGHPRGKSRNRRIGFIEKDVKNKLLFCSSGHEDVFSSFIPKSDSTSAENAEVVLPHAPSILHLEI
jgi:hypothetical protein